MKIELHNEDKIVVQLTSMDLKTLDITYEDMDYANIETRRVIWTLLDEARRVLGKDISTTERMLIEALPSEDGGCVLYFTVLPSSGCENSGKRLVMKKEAEPILLY
ncbi:MAG TPA: adaptor protein MecA, partial [Clostridiales bacterium]|nr:adaptor protein MecA [Clostridiales bacterium]